MWNNVHIDSNDQYCNDCTPTISTDNTSNTTTYHVGNERNADLQYHSMFGLDGYTDGVPSTNFGFQSQVDFKKDNQVEDKVLRNPSIVSNEPVDISDNEIFDMWNNVHIDSNDQYCNDCTPTISTDNTSNTTTYHVGNERNADLQYHSMFGLDGYTPTMQDMQ